MLGVLVIVFGVLCGLLRFLFSELASARGMDVEGDRRRLRQRLGYYLLLGLEFLIAADIIDTLMKPEPRELITLGDLGMLLCQHGLHIDLVIDRTHPIGRQHPAGIKDVVLESALTTIMDCEDSVAAVDAADKTVVYRNWCGIMRGTLTASVPKGGGTIDRRLNPDREYTGRNGAPLKLHGRSLLLVRHVGSHVGPFGWTVR